MKNVDLYITLEEAAVRLFMRTTTVQQLFNRGLIEGKVVDDQLLLNEWSVDEMAWNLNNLGPLAF